MKRIIFTLSLLAMFMPILAFAQDSDDNMSIQAGYGTVTMGGVQWQRFSFRPDIPLGKFGLGLDLELFIDETGKISDEGWNFSNKNRTWDTITRKIYYARYGEKFDPIYARAGALDNITMGYGLIMDNYRNTLNYPADKKLGVDFAVRDIGSFGLDFHTMINSVGDFKNKGAVVGARVAFRPLKPSGSKLLSKLTVGATVVRDINQFAGLADSDDDGYPDFQDGFPDDKKRWADSDSDGFEDAIDIDMDGDNILDTRDSSVEEQNYINIEESSNGVTVWGFDAGLPLLEGPVRLDLYAQYADIHTGDTGFDGGWGIGAPGLRLLAGRFLAQAEYRHFEGRFRPAYFDNLYEHERVRLVGTSTMTKENSLVDESLNGFHARTSYNLFDFVDLTAGYQYMTGDRTFNDLIGRVEVGQNALKMIPKISLLEGYFYNTYVDPDQYKVWELSPNTFYGTRIGFEVTPGVIIVWDTRYTFSPNAKGGLDKDRFVAIETVLSVK